MADGPDPQKVAGPYLPQYDVYYKKLDPNGGGIIGALEAATFLKESGLSDEILGKIWDYSDRKSCGFLDRSGLFVACKLIALYQNQIPLTMDNIEAQCPAPFFGKQTAPGAPTTKPDSKPKSLINFLVKPDEKRRYDALFDKLQPTDDKIPGEKARQVMMGSKLSTNILGNIWDMSDVDRDGFLDRYEFTVAMHLVYRALQGDPIPAELPAELSRNNVPKSLSVMPDFSSGTAKPSGIAVPTVQAIPWVINAGDRLRYDAHFKQTDTDRDGFVSGIEIKNVFLQTGLPQNMLAHIWNLCDMNQEGKLNPEQFALAMWLIQRLQAGKDPPAALTPDMVPPSMRPKVGEGASDSIYHNPELEMMAKEIQSLLSEKMQLEKEIQESEYGFTVKKGEMGSLQGEYDTLFSTLKQLNNQKEVAQKRLDSLDDQNFALEGQLKSVIDAIHELKQEITKLQAQADEQEATLVAQETEISNKKNELEGLKEEEKELANLIKKSQKEIDRIDTEGIIVAEVLEETREQLTSLYEAEAHMRSALASFGEVMCADAQKDVVNVPDSFLEPLRLCLQEPDYTRLDPKPQKPDVTSTSFGGASLETPEGVGVSCISPDWASNDAFASNFGQSTKGVCTSSVFDSSPFRIDSFDPFASQSRFNTLSPADAGIMNSAHSDSSAESPTPVLPPKNKSAPPRRPPPPKRPPPPGSADDGWNTNSDIIPNGSQASTGFADFANFGQLNMVPSDSGYASNFENFTHPTELLGFPEDPFKNVNHRYCDPFDVESSQTSKKKPVSIDPFTAPVDLAFGRTPLQDPWSSQCKNDPFDPFLSQLDPFGMKNVDEICSIKISDNKDPFGGSFMDNFTNPPVKCLSKKEEKKKNLGLLPQRHQHSQIYKQKP